MHIQVDLASQLTALSNITFSPAQQHDGTSLWPDWYKAGITSLIWSQGQPRPDILAAADALVGSGALTTMANNVAEIHLLVLVKDAYQRRVITMLRMMAWTSATDRGSQSNVLGHLPIMSIMCQPYVLQLSPGAHVLTAIMLVWSVYLAFLEVMEMRLHARMLGTLRHYCFSVANITQWVSLILLVGCAVVRYALVASSSDAYDKLPQNTRNAGDWTDLDPASDPNLARMFSNSFYMIAAYYVSI